MNVKVILKRSLPGFILDILRFIRLTIARIRLRLQGPTELQKFNIMVTKYCLNKVDRFLLPEIRDFVFSDDVTYCADGLITNHSVEWMHEPKFAEAYRLAEATGSLTTKAGIVNKIMWRTYTLCWVAYRAKDLEGDFVECGVEQGAASRAIIHYIDFETLPKTFYLMDTFCGFPEDSITPEEQAMGITGGEFYECYEEVKKRFNPFKNVKLIRGRIPDTLPQVKSEKIAYLHMDLNCAKPEILAAHYFWDKLVTGAFVILDDYGWQKYIYQKKAWDQFAESKNIKILTLPTGQGLLVKP